MGQKQHRMSLKYLRPFFDLTGATSPQIDFARRATLGLLLLPSDTSSHYKKNARQIIGKETFDLRRKEFRMQIRQKPRDEMDEF